MNLSAASSRKESLHPAITETPGMRQLNQEMTRWPPGSQREGKTPESWPWPCRLLAGGSGLAISLCDALLSCLFQTENTRSRHRVARIS